VEAEDVAIERLRLGEAVEVEMERLATLDLPEPEGSPLAGLLGSDVLARFPSVTIDYEAGELRLRGTGDERHNGPLP
jgi:hypothetical protein